MALWGMTDNANNSTIFAAAQVNRTPDAANRTALFGNTTVGAFQNNGVNMKIAVGQFGISTTEAANTVSGGYKGSTRWLEPKNSFHWTTHSNYSSTWWTSIR